MDSQMNYKDKIECPYCECEMIAHLSLKDEGSYALCPECDSTGPKWYPDDMMKVEFIRRKTLDLARKRIACQNTQNGTDSTGKSG